jgi:hypothetical protein
VLKPDTLALSTTDCEASARLSSTAWTLKVLEAAPARIVTVAGTVAALVSLLFRVTIRSALVSVLRVHRIAEPAKMTPLKMLHWRQPSWSP